MSYASLFVARIFLNNHGLQCNLACNNVVPARLLTAKISPPQFPHAQGRSVARHQRRQTNPALWSDAFTTVIENTEAFQPNFAQEAREASIVAAKSMIAVTKKLRSSRRMPSLRCHRNFLKSSCSARDDSCHRSPYPFAHSTSIGVELRVSVVICHTFAHARSFVVVL